jgi:hypothetical protein
MRSFAPSIRFHGALAPGSMPSLSHETSLKYSDLLRREEDLITIPAAATASAAAISTAATATATLDLRTRFVYV